MVKATLAGTWVPGEEGFDEAWIDEQGLRDMPRNRRAGRRFWQGTLSSGPELRVDPLLRDRQGPAVGYAYALYTQLQMDAELRPDQPVLVHVRHRGRLRVFIDGQVVYDAHPRPDGGWQTARVPATLTGLDDVVLVKMGRGSPALGPSMDFELRLSDPEGRPVPDRVWQTKRMHPVDPPPGYGDDASGDGSGATGDATGDATGEASGDAGEGAGDGTNEGPPEGR